MPRVITQNRIPRVPIPRNRIAQPPASVSAAGAGIGAMILSATPITLPGYKRSDLCTEADIAAVRRAGVLPTPPTFTVQKGPQTGPGALGMTTGTPTFNADTAGTAWSKTAAGDGWVLQVATDNTLAAGFIGMGGGVRAQPILSGISGSSPSLSYTNGEFQLITSGGIWGFSLAGKTMGTTTAVNPTKYGNTNPTGGLGQLVFFKGLYVVYQISNVASPIRYSTDNRATWTACTVPALNADGSAQGGCINSIIVDVSGNFLIGVTGYGETLTSPDGIVWTKTNTKAPAGTNNNLFSLVQTPSGKLFCASGASGSGGVANVVFMAPDVNSPFTQVSLGAVGMQVASGLTYQAGQLWVSSTSNAVVLAAVSNDEGVTWAALPLSVSEGGFSTGFTFGLGIAGGREGVIWIFGAPSGAGLPSAFWRLDTDWAKATAPVVNPITNAFSRWYVKVS